MARMSIIVVFFAGIFCMSSFSMVLPESEAKKIHQNVKELVTAWNERRMDDFANFFTEDVNFVNIRGQEIKGREALAKREVKLHENPNTQLVINATTLAMKHYGVVHVILRWQTVDEKGVNLNGIWSLVFKRSVDEWLIAVAHNTLIEAKL
jgi:uncharacterized protein (TIGR02246 family)